MFRYAFVALRLAALTAALLALSAASGEAAPPRPAPSRGPAVSAYRGGYHAGYYGGAYVRPGYYGRYYPRYYYPRVGVGIGLYYTPYVYNYPTYVYSPPVVEYPTVTTLTPTIPTPTVNAAVIRVHVPADADLWFNGDLTAQRGEYREFLTPALTPGRDYSYDLRARWTGAGGMVDMTRTIVVRANEPTTVDFMRPEAIAAPGRAGEYRGR